MKKSSLSLLVALVFGLCMFFPVVAFSAVPILDYHLDACSLTSGVDDNSSNGYDAVSVGVKTESNTTTGGGICKSGKFQKGNSDYLDAGNILSPNDSNWTTSVWVKWDGSSGDNIIYNKENLYEARVSGGYFQYAWQPHWNWDGGTTMPVTAGEWNHFVITYNGVKQIVYQNGVEKFIRAQTGNIGSNTSKLLVGARGSNNPNSFFGGNIDEFKIFNEALSAAEVLEIYNNENAGKNYNGNTRECLECIEPVANYQLDECSWSGVNGDVKDSSGNDFDITSKNGASTEDSAIVGGVCKVGDFDGTNDKLSGDFNQTFANELTITAWFKTSGGSQSYGRMVEFGSNNGDYLYSTALAYDASGNTIRGWTYGSGTRSGKVSYNLSTNGYHDDAWHFIAYTHDGTQAKLYIDNVLVDTANTNINDIEDATTLTIGGYAPSDSYTFKGYIDEVKVFDKALDKVNSKQLDLTSIYENEKNKKNYDGTKRNCGCVKPKMDIRFDDCKWDGTSSEVTDSSGNGYNGKSIGAIISSDSIMCKSGAFEKVNTQYIDMKNVLNPLSSDWSTSVWVKWDGGSGDSIIYNKENLYEARVSGGYFQYAWQPHWAWDGGTTMPVTVGEWNHFVVTYDHDMQRVYQNGVLKYQRVQSGDIGQNANKLLIGARGHTSASSFFNGKIDEFKVYDSALNTAQVEAIFANEKVGKNADGTGRNCQCCIDYSGVIVPLEFEGAEIKLKNTASYKDWTAVDFNKSFSKPPIVFILPEARGEHPTAVRVKDINKTGFKAIFAEPQGEDGPHYDQSINFLAVNKGVHKIGSTYFEVGSIDTKKVQQASQGSIVSDEWEKVDNIFTSCVPAVVGQIQSINNEKGIDIPSSNIIQRSRPWITTAIDTNNSGVYIALERSETDEENITTPEIIGYMIAPGNIQDEVEDDNNNKIKFETILKRDYFVGWDDRCKSVNFVNTYTNIPLVAASKNSKNEFDGGWVRRCELDNTKIGLQIDEDGSTYSRVNQGYSSPPQDKERSHLAETASIFVFSGTIVIREDMNLTKSYFDAWDRLSDKYISTKIFEQDIMFDIVAMDINSTNLQDYNGTVCVKLVDDLNQSLSAWKQLYFSAEDFKNIIFNSNEVNSTSKDARVNIVWKDEVNEPCPLSNETNSTLSSDNFAIRPEKFSINIPLSHKAGEGFSFDVVAGIAGALSSKEYDTNITSFDINISDTSKVCEAKDADFNLTTISFTDGVSNQNARFGDVGVVDINITDKEWAKVDLDKNQTSKDCNGGWICGYKADVKITPYKFEINATHKDRYSDFTYLSQDLNMSSALDINITAQNEQNLTTQNYSSSCYAKNIDITIKHSNVNSSNLQNILYIYKDSLDTNSSKNSILKGSDISLSSYSGTNFTTDHNGTAPIVFYMNFDRDRAKPVEKFDFNITDVNATDTDSVSGANSSAGTAHFYYGRVKTSDVTTNKKDIDHSLHVEVYKAPSLTKQNSLNWYEMSLDDDRVVSDINDSKKFDSIDATDITINSYSYNGGVLTFKIENPNEVKKAYMHISAPKYLWYSKYVDYSSSSDCSKHPCFEYNYISDRTQKNIKSGNFNGSSIGSDYNATKTKRGVKVFR